MDLQEGWVFQYKDRVRVGVGTCRAFQWWGLPPVSRRNRCVVPSMSRLGFSKNQFAKPVPYIILHINKKKSLYSEENGLEAARVQSTCGT